MFTLLFAYPTCLEQKAVLLLLWLFDLLIYFSFI
uniref:Uncharacterized protein n=1 Tax=Arundo donax TaxID=35708 RepID=A0A0A8YV10_ARUDO